MNSCAPAQRLLDIVDLEAQALDDRAMIGGLSRYADTWVREAREYYGPEAYGWVDSVARHVRRYSQLNSRSDRALAIAELRRLMADAPSLGDRASEPAAHRTIDETCPSAPTEHAVSSAAPPDAAASPGRPAGMQGETQPTRASSRREAAPASDNPGSGPGDVAGLDSPVTALRGVGPRQARRLKRLGIITIRNMLYYFPRRYDDFSDLRTIRRLEYGEEVTVVGRVESTRLWRTTKGTPIFRARLSDGSGSVDVTWFNQPYLDGVIRRGQQLVVSGTVEQYLGHLCFRAPQWETLGQELLHTARIVPVYPLTEGVRAKWLRRLMKRTIDYWSKRLPDHLPPPLRRSQGLMGLESAIVQVHFPHSHDALRQARRRLAFDELFALQIGLLRRRSRWQSAPASPVAVDDAAVERFLATLPYLLTSAQRESLRSILADMGTTSPMARLLQGDVGSGKTVVAAAAIMAAVAAGGQAAVMAPTGILAEQHWATLSQLFEPLPEGGPRVALLTNTVQGEERERVYAGLADGRIDVAVGTHALIEGAVQFADLRLAVIDEQHRFGVAQRSALGEKGQRPHILTMTATPIPRSLALTVWGHLDVSTIDEMPPGRLRVETRVVPPAGREHAYSFVRSQVEHGRQGFVICPLVEESDAIDAKSAVAEHARLQSEVFPDLRLGLLHGRMATDDKDTTMARFLGGEYDILVATSVVEVGIDVPNASVMLIEGAERFGLAQLHQFRGRVGRAAHQSYCLLLPHDPSELGWARLEILERTQDGFALAEKDLEMRGPGEFLGTRQSGLPPLQLATVTDLDLVREARDLAVAYYAEDPELADPDNRLLARRVAQMWGWDEEPG